MANKKIFKADTKVKVFNNSSGRLEWRSRLTNRLIIWNKPGVPAMVSFEDLQDIAWNDSVWFPEGLIYIPDKEAFDALEVPDMKWEDVKPIQEIKSILNILDVDKLIEQIKQLKEEGKEALATHAFEIRDKLTGSQINAVEEATGIKLKQMIDDYNANQDNIKKNSKS